MEDVKNNLNDEFNEKKESSFQEEIIKINKSLSSLRERIDINGNEINQLQLGGNKSKVWWKNSSTIISILAITLSCFTTIYSVIRESKKEIVQYKLRTKEIVQRLSEIQTLYVNAGSSLGNIQQSTFAEVSNLVDEAISISKIDYKYLNDAEYSTIIAMAFQTNKTENLNELFQNALKTVDDVSTEYSIKNYQANYYFLIKKEYEKGRAVIKDVIAKTENQEVHSDMKKVNIAYEYSIWSGLEFQCSNYNECDSLLKIAEDLIVSGKDAWKFKNYPAVQQIVNSRDYFNKFKASSDYILN